MEKIEYLNNAMNLLKVEKEIIDLESEIKYYIENNEIDESKISKDDLLNLGSKYSKLYSLKRKQEYLFEKVALGYDKLY